MATKKSTMDFILDQLSSLENVNARKMFGEYALYYDGKVVGLVIDDTLFIKTTSQGKDFAGEHYKRGRPFTGAKWWIKIDSDIIEDRDWLAELVRITVDNLPRLTN